MNNVHRLLEEAISHNASDLLIAAGSRPTLRVDGKLIILSYAPFTKEEAEEAVYDIIDSSIRDIVLESGSEDVDVVSGEHTDQMIQMLRRKEELDLVFTISGLARVRANLFLHRHTFGAALRIIPINIQSIDELNLPEIFKTWASQPQGLVIISGPTCSGKSTTVASMVDHINNTREAHIITIEDPIEHLYEDNLSIIHQREVGADTKSFASALRAMLRQTPDVIVIGEMRDVETLSVAISAAEVGHLVIATFHTTSASAAIDRIINSFPSESRQQIAMQLASSLVGVSSQRLITNSCGVGRLPALEIMTNSPTIRKHIEEMQINCLPNDIREGKHYGMHTMNQYLENLHQNDAIGYEDALLCSSNPTELKQMLRRS